jgi:hypothetical protein
MLSQDDLNALMGDLSEDKEEMATLQKVESNSFNQLEGFLSQDDLNALMGGFSENKREEKTIVLMQETTDATTNESSEIMSQDEIDKLLEMYSK